MYVYIYIERPVGGNMSIWHTYKKAPVCKGDFWQD